MAPGGLSMAPATWTGHGRRAGRGIRGGVAVFGVRGVRFAFLQIPNREDWGDASRRLALRWVGGRYRSRKSFQARARRLSSPWVTSAVTTWRASEGSVMSGTPRSTARRRTR